MTAHAVVVKRGTARRLGLRMPEPWFWNTPTAVEVLTNLSETLGILSKAFAWNPPDPIVKVEAEQ